MIDELLERKVAAVRKAWQERLAKYVDLMCSEPTSVPTGVEVSAEKRSTVEPPALDATRIVPHPVTLVFPGGERVQCTGLRTTDRLTGCTDGTDAMPPVPPGERPYAEDAVLGERWEVTSVSKQPGGEHFFETAGQPEAM